MHAVSLLTVYSSSSIDSIRRAMQRELGAGSTDRQPNQLAASPRRTSFTDKRTLDTMSG